MSRRPTYVIQPELFRISIKGTPLGKMQAPDDQGLVGNLLGLISDRKLPAPVHIEQSGAGTFIGLFHMEDAQEILQWLEERADEAVEHPK